MAMMLNIVPVDAKANASLQNTNKKSNNKSDKLASGFAAVLTKQADKKEVDDGVSNGKDEAAAQLMAAFAGVAVLPTPVNLMESSNQGEVVPETTNNEQMETVTQLPNLVGNDQTQIDSSTSVKVSQKNLEALLTKMTGVNESVNIGNVAEVVQVQGQGYFLGKSQKEQVVEPALGIDSSLKEADTLLNAVPSIVMDNGVIKNNSKQSIDSKRITSNQSNTGGAATTDLAELVGDDVKAKSNLQPMVNIVAAVKEDSSTNELVLGTKEQLHTEGMLPDKAANNSDVFSSLLNQPVVKNEGQVTLSDTKQVQQQPVKDPYHITSQIVDQARLIEGQKNTEMIIRLKPEHLGELTFKVTVENGVVSASFHSNNAEVRNMLEASLIQLKQDLSNQGLKVENVGIYAGLGEFFSNGQRESQKKPEVKVQNRKVEEDFIEALESSNLSENASDASGVDYRV
jgi:flagellar hook-length control protein FliK